MKQNVQMKSPKFAHWLAGLCAVAAVIAGFRTLYGMFQVWTGEITSIPFIGELMYPSDADTGSGWLLSFFVVGFGGVAYAYMWLALAGTALAVFAFLSNRNAMSKKSVISLISSRRYFLFGVTIGVIAAGVLLETGALE